MQLYVRLFIVVMADLGNLRAHVVVMLFGRAQLL